MLWVGLGPVLRSFPSGLPGAPRHRRGLPPARAGAAAGDGADGARAPRDGALGRGVRRWNERSHWSILPSQGLTLDVSMRFLLTTPFPQWRGSSSGA